MDGRSCLFVVSVLVDGLVFGLFGLGWFEKTLKLSYEIRKAIRGR